MLVEDNAMQVEELMDGSNYILVNNKQLNKEDISWLEICTGFLQTVVQMVKIWLCDWQWAYYNMNGQEDQEDISLEELCATLRAEDRAAAEKNGQTLTDDEELDTLIRFRKRAQPGDDYILGDEEILNGF